MRALMNGLRTRRNTLEVTRALLSNRQGVNDMIDENGSKAAESARKRPNCTRIQPSTDTKLSTQPTGLD